MSRMNDGDWRERVGAAREGRAAKPSRNERVADLWSDRGWGDDDFFAEEEAVGLGQREGPKYKGRSYRRRQQWERDAKQVHRVGDATAQRAITAHGMVQSFISSFSDEFGFRVAYADAAVTGAPAATSFEQKLVLVDPSPLFDKSLTGSQCGLIMTALACHEVSHVLFDRHHGDAVRDAIKTLQALALRVSNILSDRRIEMRFAAKYPGYSDVFDPLLEYVCRDFHGHQVTFDPKDPGNLAVAAVRFAKWLDWSAPGMAAERDWWDDLATRAAQSDDVDWHVQHVIEGMKRLAKLKRNAPKPEPEPHPFRP